MFCGKRGGGGLCEYILANRGGFLEVIKTAAVKNLYLCPEIDIATYRNVLESTSLRFVRDWASKCHFPSSHSA
jgi:hypothetical protein